MYNLDIKPEADKIFKKLSKKSSEQLKIIHKKIFKIRLNPYHKYKFLKDPLQFFNRVHMGSFVLVFKINHKERVVDIYYYDHHDKIYKWRPTK